MSRIELRMKWEERIREFQASGQSAPSWCAAQQVSVQSLRYWLRRFHHSHLPAEPLSDVRWIALDLEPAHRPDPSSLTVRIGDVCVDVHRDFDPALLQQVVAALTAVC
ncbi:MAG: IS66 family insertion sequence element accessory protein TnpA [Candidatus Nanopelagicales bacterium]